MTFKFFCDSVALLCTIPSAFLAFKSRFIENFKFQCVDLLQNQDPNYNRNIRLDHRILASLFWGIKNDLDWMQIFGGTNNPVLEKMQSDRSDAVRGLGWFLFFVIFASISLFLR